MQLNSEYKLCKGMEKLQINGKEKSLLREGDSLVSRLFTTSGALQSLI